MWSVMVFVLWVDGAAGRTESYQEVLTFLEDRGLKMKIKSEAFSFHVLIIDVDVQMLKKNRARHCKCGSILPFVVSNIFVVTHLTVRRSWMEQSTLKLPPGFKA